MRKYLVLVAVALLAGLFSVSDALQKVGDSVTKDTSPSTTSGAVTVGVSKHDTLGTFRWNYGDYAADSLQLTFRLTATSSVSDSVGFVPAIIGRYDENTSWATMKTFTDSTTAAVTNGNTAVFYYWIGVKEMIYYSRTSGTTTIGVPREFAVILSDCDGTSYYCQDTATVTLTVDYFNTDF